MEVLGISRTPIDAGLTPLEHLIRFDGHWSPMSGYFFLIAPAFQEFTLHGDSIEGLHALARASGPSLRRGLDICAVVEANILNHPDRWRDVLGTIKKPGQSEIVYQPLIVRRRALAMIYGIRKLFEIAQSEKGEVIFGNGAFDMPLSGLKLPPGVEYYS